MDITSNISQWDLPWPGDQSVEIKVNEKVHPSVLQAMQRLERHPHFRGRTKWIECRFQNGCLYLFGKLPSFYLKQLAQEAIRDIDGVDRIENTIEVARPESCDALRLQ